MKQRYHTIIKPESNGAFVGWVEEIPGTISQGRSLQECRQNLRDALELMVETYRDEARIGVDRSCIEESIEIDVTDVPAGTAGMPSVAHAATSSHSSSPTGMSQQPVA